MENVLQNPCESCDVRKAIVKLYLTSFDVHWFSKDDCPYYIHNKHDRGDDSLCRYLHQEIKEVQE